MNPICSCIICKKEFSVRGIHSHYLTAHTKEGNQKIKKSGLSGCHNGGAAYAQKMAEIKFIKITEYEQNPKLCKHCQTPIPFTKKGNNFCNSSCSASFNNKIKSYDNAKQTWKNKFKDKPKSKKIKITEQKSNKSKFKPYIISKKLQPSGPYSKIFSCNCSHCKVKFYYRTQKKYCINCEHLYSHDGRAKYWFTFNVFHYPELFDLSLITTYGFRDNKTNPNGITRDHKISVNDAIKYNYDPYYIKHPMNCELMFFNENNKKKTNSSISYEHLIELVNNYDNK